MSDVTTFYLEMKSPEEIQGKEKPAGLDVIEAEVKEFRNYSGNEG